MKRGRLFMIGLIAAIATIISLHVAFGRMAYIHDSRSFYNSHHHCGNRFYNEKPEHKKTWQNDSTHQTY
jgi:hypothetical protein